MSIPPWPNKDPDDVLDYGLDFGPILEEGDALSSVTWAITPDGLVKGQEGRIGNVAIVWLSGGQESRSYLCTARAVTTAGRTFDRSRRIFVTSR